MKKQMLQFSSLVMALMVLFVSIGWDVQFHYCTVDHELTSSFGDAAATCEHCAGHHHEHETNLLPPSGAVQFNAKCCCDDFDQLIHFSDTYTFSTEKSIWVSLPSVIISDIILIEEEEAGMALRCFTREKIPYLITGRLRTIFFSNLKLFPLPIEHPYGMPF